MKEKKTASTHKKFKTNKQYFDSIINGVNSLMTEGKI